MNSKYLIVEGVYDKIFYEALFKKIRLRGIEIRSPQDFSSPYNGKGNCIKLLAELIPQFNDGRISKIALIVDADFINLSSQGFSNTLNDIDQTLFTYGYNKVTMPCNHQNGIIFSNSNGLPDIAVWIMPNNKDEGYIEYFLKEAVHSNQATVLEEAITICNNMKSKQFSDHHLAKSEVAVFMAMQDNPGRNITHMLEKSYIDTEKAEIKRFCTFINNYYRQ